MDLKKLIIAGFQSAIASEINESNEGKRNRQRSQLWVDALGKQFRAHFEGDPSIKVFWKGNYENRDDFGLNELLFDISVCEVASTRSAFHDSELLFVKRALWEIESEFSRESHQALIDFSKLNMGRAEYKLFIGPLVSDNESYLDVLRLPAEDCSGEIYVVLVPHPGEWDVKSKTDIELYKFVEGGWQGA